jgi:hypothetical protein
MDYLTLLLVHRKGNPAVLYVSGKEVGVFKDSVFTCNLESVRGILDPFSESDIRAVLGVATRELARIPASLAEPYFSAMVMLYTEDRVSHFKNGLPVKLYTERVFPYPLGPVTEALVLLEAQGRNQNSPVLQDKTEIIRGHVAELLRAGNEHAVLQILALINEEIARHKPR